MLLRLFTNRRFPRWSGPLIGGLVGGYVGLRNLVNPGGLPIGWMVLGGVLIGCFAGSLAILLDPKNNGESIGRAPRPFDGSESSSRRFCRQGSGAFRFNALLVSVYWSGVEPDRGTREPRNRGRVLTRLKIRSVRWGNRVSRYLGRYHSGMVRPVKLLVLCCHNDSLLDPY